MEISGAGAGGVDREREIWGTLEELLLVCAVDRHGTRCWDSVASEIQSRIPLSPLLTPQSCRQRYLLLRRRFSAADGGAGQVDGEEGGDSPPPSFPWLAELRELRVSELRREVERYDRSIGLLQLKLKRLEEDRERSVKETESGEAKPPDREAKDDEELPETVAGDRISGGPLIEESDSIDPKDKEKVADDEEVAAGTNPVAGGDKASAVATLGEGSCNGSTEGGRPRVSGESIAESKGGSEGDGEEEEKESSDVQSSASLSRRRRKEISGSCSGGEEAEVSKRAVAAKANPLVSFLESARSKFGSVLDRRLESQDSERYRCLIRRHVDLEMVRSMLDRIGSYTPIEFFRDLLLFCTNIIVFYPKDSPESLAASHLRRLVINELSTTVPRPAPVKLAPLPTSAAGEKQPKLAVLKPKPDPDIAGSLLDKPSSSAPLIVCRKRSSINKVAMQVKEDKEKAREKEEKDKYVEAEEKVKDDDENSLMKKSNKEKPLLTGSRSLRTKKKLTGGAQVMKRPVLSLTPNLKAKPVEVSPPPEAVAKADKKSSGGGGSNSGIASGKKNNPATLLNRLKRSSGTNTLMESLKSSPSSGSGSKGSEQKKGNKGDSRKEQQGGSQGNAGSAGSKKVATLAEEANSHGRKMVGRPPKRMAPVLTPPPAKRAKEDAENSKLPPVAKKRARR